MASRRPRHLERRGELSGERMLNSIGRLRRGFGSSLALSLAGAMSAGEPLLAADGSGPQRFLNCAAQCFEPFLRQELSQFDLVRQRGAIGGSERLAPGDAPATIWQSSAATSRSAASPIDTSCGSG
jgi:hypothetical protein